MDERHNEKKYVLVIMDGAADSQRVSGRSPLMLARMTHCDFIASSGVNGLMHTLYPDLPKESMVAQLGMLGWNPYRYYPHGRSSSELLGSHGKRLGPDELAFRANFVHMQEGVLKSYNADYINTAQAVPLIEKINSYTHAYYPDFELFHNSDFRNTLLVRGFKVNPGEVDCHEPHESIGVKFDCKQIVRSRGSKALELVSRINSYLAHVGTILAQDRANMLLPWSPSTAFELPAFKENMDFDGRAAIVGCTDFLHGIAVAGNLDFFCVGNGRPDTDYKGKGQAIVKLLNDGYQFVVCHINAPDEASHMGDLELKIRCLELIDEWILGPLVRYFLKYFKDLGAVAIAADHYTNTATEAVVSRRADIHSLEPVPFAVWNFRDRDSVLHYSEDYAAEGRFGNGAEIGHMQFLPALFGIGRSKLPRAGEATGVDSLIPGISARTGRELEQ